MRITSSEVTAIALPFRETYRTAAGAIDERPMAVVRIETHDGVAGHGEAVPLTLRGGAGIGPVSAELRAAAELLEGTDVGAPAEGDPAATAAWIDELIGRCEAAGTGPPALCAIDQALHDLAGRLADEPAWKLLGASHAGPVPCNASIAGVEPEVAAEQARIDATRGFRTFKVKVGTGDDAGRIAAVRKAIGPAPRVRVDANGAWSVAEASERITGLDHAAEGLELAEQPCASLGELGRLRDQCRVPLVADESVTSLEEARTMVAEGACDAATLKLAKVGGPRAALRIAAAAPVYLSSALDGPIGIAAALHTAQALPAHGFASGLAHGLATLDMFSATYSDADGLCGPAVTPPDGPGLGVEPDRAILRAMEIRA
jgi:L-alanine-DL-glutamate epimerase-like enolase superfamily enzyme